MSDNDVTTVQPMTEWPSLGWRAEDPSVRARRSVLTSHWPLCDRSPHSLSMCVCARLIQLKSTHSQRDDTAHSIRLLSSPRVLSTCVPAYCSALFIRRMSPLVLLAAKAVSEWTHDSLTASIHASLSTNGTLTSFLQNSVHYLIHNNQWSLILAFTLLSLAAGLYTALTSTHHTAISVTHLYIYPLKGAAPIQLDEAHYDRLGFKHDRRFMAVKKTARIGDFTFRRASEYREEAVRGKEGLPVFHSQRQHPRMSLMRPAIDDKTATMTLTAPDQPSLKVPLTPPPTSPLVAVKVWDDIILTSMYEDEHTNEWLTTFFGEPTVLVTIIHGSTAEHHRPLDARFDPSAPELNIHTSFTDGYPFLLTSAVSLRALNAAIPSKRIVPMVAFRPNIVVDGPPQLLPAWAEDYWAAVEVGDGEVLDVTKPCDRCAVPTTLIDEGKRDPLYEPVITMRQQRTMAVEKAGGAVVDDGKVYFGMNCIQRRPSGSMRVGDVVKVVAKKQRFIEPLYHSRKREPAT